jgi:hypothetical protein
MERLEGLLQRNDSIAVSIVQSIVEVDKQVFVSHGS